MKVQSNFRRADSFHAGLVGFEMIGHNFSRLLPTWQMFTLQAEMRIFNIFLLFAGLIFASELRVSAWSGPGHMVIAAEAYRQLPPDLQKRVTEILKAHPAYSKWETAFAKYGDGMDLQTFIFMSASTWPDQIRRGGGADSQYDHPHWHYIDYPLTPPDFPKLPGPAQDDDVLYGVAQCEKFLADANATPVLKAVYLSYLVHLVGDMHQPLHCCSLVTATYPKGDKGGNDFYVMPASRGIKLHALWDQLLGSRPNQRTALNDAVRIQSEHPRQSLPELAKDTTPKSWSLESRQLAIDKAYLHGDLKGSTTAESAPPLPDGYTKEAKKVAEKQAALAGDRLADEIKEYSH